MFLYTFIIPANVQNYMLLVFVTMVQVRDLITYTGQWPGHSGSIASGIPSPAGHHKEMKQKYFGMLSRAESQTLVSSFLSLWDDYCYMCGNLAKVFGH